jgi:hypothetical protein
VPAKGLSRDVEFLAEPGRHLVWLRRKHFDAPGLQVAFDAEHEAVLQAEARRDRLDKAIEAMAADSEYTPVVHRLGCLRGIATLTAFGLAVEIGDWDRLTGSTIGAYLGLVPTESSSGQSRSQGSITKTGNTHDYQDRQHPCPPAAGRGRLAAPEALPHPRGHHEGQVGAGTGGCPGPRTRRQPAATPALAALHPAQERPGDR